jgi:hypothetical protein
VGRSSGGCSRAMSPKVFVSYSHDSEAHKARVRDFVARLRGEGIVVLYDEDVANVGGPNEGWPRWCERQIGECDYILACCTAMFHERFDGRQQAATGRGVAWEAHSVRQYLYDNPDANQKVRPLILAETDLVYVPNALRSFHIFLATHDESYAQLLGWLGAATGIIAAETAVAPEIAVDWLPPAQDFSRRLADRSDEFDRLRNMLSGRDPHRALLVQGPSNSGKTAFMSECIRYAEHRRVPFSHIDFKGAQSLEDVCDSLMLDFGKEMLSETRKSERSARSLAVIEDLERLSLRKPLFIAFDTYRRLKTAETGSRQNC